MKLVSKASLKGTRKIKNHNRVEDISTISNLLVHIVVILVVRGVGKQYPKARAQREEDLRGRINPNLCLVDGIEVGTQIILYTHGRARQGDAAYQ